MNESHKRHLEEIDDGDDDDEIDFGIQDIPVTANSETAETLPDPDLFLTEDPGQAPSHEEESGGFIHRLHDEPAIFASTLSPAPALPFLQNQDKNRRKRILTENQQRKLLDFLDEKLMNVQHDFVVKDSDYTVDKLAKQMDEIVDIIWFSIVNSIPSKAVTNITDENKPKTTALFGQSHYLLTVSDSIVEFITTIPHSNDTNSIRNLIRLLQKLDQLFSWLLDKSLLTKTEIVRLESIAERSRVVLMNVYADLEGFEVDLANIYTLTLDRIT